ERRRLVRWIEAARLRWHRRRLGRRLAAALLALRARAVRAAPAARPTARPVTAARPQLAGARPREPRRLLGLVDGPLLEVRLVAQPALVGEPRRLLVLLGVAGLEDRLRRCRLGVLAGVRRAAVARSVADRRHPRLFLLEPREQFARLEHRGALA